MATSRRSSAEEQAWQAVRRIVLERDRWTCVECGEQPPHEELDVHHLIPRSAGGSDAASTCVTLCDGCHAGRHLNLQVSLARRTIERWALALARFLDRGRELPDEARTLDAGLRLFGVTRFREGQLDAVLGALRGSSQLVIRPTGAGKSLCFQLPAILKGQPATFVLSPLKTLMVDQTGGLHRRKLPATFINSDIGRDEKQARYELLEQGAWSILYMAPERFGEKVKPQEIARLANHRPSFLVVDEAHRTDPPLGAIITTSAFSMGVDIPDVRLVVHWQHPASVEDYLQEFGRAGRDGKPALALLCSMGEADTGLLSYMASSAPLG